MELKLKIKKDQIQQILQKDLAKQNLNLQGIITRQKSVTKTKIFRLLLLLTKKKFIVLSLLKRNQKDKIDYLAVVFKGKSKSKIPS